MSHFTTIPIQICDEARELASQDAREFVARFGRMGRGKLQMAG